jgi:hypothetical protein
MSESRFADAPINPSTFVKIFGAGGRVIQCVMGDIPFGIAQSQTRSSIPLNADDGFCALRGEAFQVYTVDDKEAYLELGMTVSAGDYLKPDNNGFGIVAGANDFFGARAKEMGLAGDIVPVDLLIGDLSTGGVGPLGGAVTVLGLMGVSQGTTV